MDEKAARALQKQLNGIPRLRATGPNPFDYFLWADATEAILGQIFGAASAEATAFLEAVREPGRTRDQRGNYDNMTLGLHGAWGIWARLSRAQAVLEQVLARRTPA